MASFDFLLEGPASTGLNRARTRRMEDEKHKADQLTALSNILEASQRIEEIRQKNELREEFGRQQIMSDLEKERADTELTREQAEDIDPAAEDRRSRVKVDERSNVLKEREIQQKTVQGAADRTLAREELQVKRDYNEALRKQIDAQTDEAGSLREKRQHDMERYDEANKKSIELTGMPLDMLEVYGKTGGGRTTKPVNPNPRIYKEATDQQAVIDISTIESSDPEMSGTSWPGKPMTNGKNDYPMRMGFYRKVQEEADVAYFNAAQEFETPKSSFGQEVHSWTNPYTGEEMEVPPDREFFLKAVYHEVKDNHIVKFRDRNYFIRYVFDEAKGAWVPPFQSSKARAMRDLAAGQDEDAFFAALERVPPHIAVQYFPFLRELNWWEKTFGRQPDASFGLF